MTETCFRIDLTVRRIEDLYDCLDQLLSRGMVYSSRNRHKTLVKVRHSVILSTQCRYIYLFYDKCLRVFIAKDLVLNQWNAKRVIPITFEEFMKNEIHKAVG